MTERPRIFSEEWRKCLAEHYKTVLLRHDTHQAESVSAVLSRLGFTERELESLEIGIKGASANTETQMVRENNGPEASNHDRNNLSALETSPSQQEDVVLDEIPVVEMIESETAEWQSHHQDMEVDSQDESGMTENLSPEIPQPKLFD